jgi:hypothetical protein
MPSSVRHRRASEAHPIPNGIHRLARQDAAAGRTGFQCVVHELRILRELGGTPSDRDELLLHRLGQHFLAVEAPPASSPTLVGDVLDRRRSVLRIRFGSVTAGRSLVQIASVDSSNPIVLPIDFDILD